MKKLTTLTGPSCAGKSTLEKMMVERGCMKAVSSTTRAPRSGEIDDADYYFLSKDTFLTMRHVGMFIEVVKFGEHYYGVAAAEINRLFYRGDHIVLVCEPNGAEQIQNYCKTRPDIQLTSVFIDNPTSVIADRFLRRATEDIMKAAIDPLKDHNKTTADYAKRMAMMINVEPTWRIPAYSPTPGRLSYDLVFESFDETNDERIANVLCDVPVLTM